MNKSIFGMSANKASAFAYLGFFLTGLFVFLFEQDNADVRFHGLQSSLALGMLCILTFVFWGVRFLGTFIMITTLVTWLFLTIAAFIGMKVTLPFIGSAAWAFLNYEEDEEE
jgi:uncharacterized membrane protein